MKLNTFQRWWMNSWLHRVRIRQHVPPFLKAAPEPMRGEILEVGAGGGFTSQSILETFPQVELTSTDIDPDATAKFAELKEKYGRRLFVKEANLLSLPFDRSSFDMVLAVNVFWNFSEEDMQQALQQTLRVLRPGGLLGISEYFTPAASRANTRAVIERVLGEENCDILYTKGKNKFDLWARKPYPVKGGAK